MSVIFGGTFDPIHLGHILPLLALQEQYQIGPIGLMPNQISPHKTSTPPTATAHRVAMIKLAIADHPQLYLEDIELLSNEVSFTSETVLQLHARAPTTPLSLVIGADSYANLHTWHDVDTILSHASFIVLPRGGHSALAHSVDNHHAIVQKNINLDTPLHPLRIDEACLQGRIYYANTPLHEISSSEIRRALKNQDNIAKYLPKCVLNYIYQHQLYQS
jgi:nicotinate-nucleotide adenylyltransferase